MDYDKKLRKKTVFERKILRRIYGPICEGGQWRKTYKRELEGLHDEPNIANVIKSSRPRWAGHVGRRDENELLKNIVWTNPGRNQGRGRMKSRCIDEVEEDKRKLSSRNWRAVVQDRGRWRHSLEEAKAHPGLYSRWWWWWWWLKLFKEEVSTAVILNYS